jgi:uncharacterized protein (TIGR00645 family)
MKPTDQTSGRAPGIGERTLEQGIFAGRWILAPIYAGLTLSLLMLLVKFGQEFWHMASSLISSDSDDVILGVLSLIDLSLMANLLLMIIFGGYQNFVSKLDLDGHKDTPDWIGNVGFSDIKLKLMASIVAISAIEVLQGFLTIEQVGTRTVAWGMAVHITFVVSALLLAAMDWLIAKSRRGRSV